MAIDVTDQAKANLELRLQCEELAHLRRVALMGELTASLAHEFNQPLTAIASNAAASTRMLANGSNEIESFQELLADVTADAHRAGNIIHGIHRFVRKTEGIRRPLDLNDTIRDVLHVLHSDLLGRTTAVDTQLARNPPAVEADSVLLQQALLNLVMNSLDAMQGTAASERRIQPPLCATEIRLCSSACAIADAVCRPKILIASLPTSIPRSRTEWGWD